MARPEASTTRRDRLKRRQDGVAHSTQHGRVGPNGPDRKDHLGLRTDLPLVPLAITGPWIAAVDFATKGGVGFGDVKFAAMIGLALGPLGLGSVCLSVFVGLAAALV